MTIESYIVRIYRRKETATHALVGVVEEVEDGEKKPFTTLEELWKILNPVKREPGTIKKGAPRAKT